LRRESVAGLLKDQRIIGGAMAASRGRQTRDKKDNKQ
jgi:hypothetical protein